MDHKIFPQEYIHYEMSLLVGKELKFSEGSYYLRIKDEK